MLHAHSQQCRPDRLEVKQADRTFGGEYTASGVVLAAILGQPCRLQCAGQATPVPALPRECWSACMTPAGVSTGVRELQSWCCAVGKLRLLCESEQPQV